jgi:hypothetical protein
MNTSGTPKLELKEHDFAIHNEISGIRLRKVRIGQPRATLFVLRVTPVFLLLHSQGQQV